MDTSMAEPGFPHILAFEEYRQQVQLDQPFMPLTIPRPDELGKLLDQLVAELRMETLALTGLQYLRRHSREARGMNGTVAEGQYQAWEYGPHQR
jgi:hypothetical protein